MGIELLIKLCGVGMLTSVINIILKKSDKDEIGMFVTIGGIFVSILMLIDGISGAFSNVLELFNL